MTRHVDTTGLARLPDRAGAALSRRGSARRRRGGTSQLPAADLRRRGARTEGAAWPRRGGRGVSAAGRRLRGIIRRVPRQRAARHAEGAAADGGGAELRRRRAGGEGRAHGGSVRQAAVAADGNDRWRHAAVVSRRHRQRHRVRCRGARAGSRADAARLQSVGDHAQSAACLHTGRVRRSGARAAMEPGVHRGVAAGRALRRDLRAHPGVAGIHGGVRADYRPMRRSFARPSSTPATMRCC